MLHFSLTSLLARRQTRRPRNLRAQEPADMGTAFGMEQWLDERDHGPAPTPTPASIAKPAAAAKVRWMPRWLQPTR